MPGNHSRLMPALITQNITLSKANQAEVHVPSMQVRGRIVHDQGLVARNASCPIYVQRCPQIVQTSRAVAL